MVILPALFSFHPQKEPGLVYVRMLKTRGFYVDMCV